MNDLAKNLFRARTVMMLSTVALFSESATAASLYFDTDGSDLLITAREADNSAEYWSLRLTQAAAGSPSGNLGSITEFFDLTGDAGSNPATNLAGTNGLLTTNITAAFNGTQINTHANASLTAPTGVDGASSYTFTITTEFPDATNSGAMATFTSQITINAPTGGGTRLDVANTLVTPPTWVTQDSLGSGGWESRSSLRSYTQTMTDATLSSYNGWEQSPRDPNQYAEKTATATTAGFADGRTFLLSQTADLDSAEINTATVYVVVENSNIASSLTQMLSGTFRGSAPADGSYSSTGYLDINIASIPEPQTYALLFGCTVLWGLILRRR